MQIASVTAPVYSVTVVMEYTHPKTGTRQETVTATTFMDLQDIAKKLARSQHRNASVKREKVRAVRTIAQDDESTAAWEIALRLAYSE